MQLSLTSFPEIVFFIVFISAIGILLRTFGSLIVNDRRRKDQGPDSLITARQVDHYFRDRGYVVCNISPVKNSNKWRAFLVKNGKYLVATVITDGESIKGHQDLLA